MATGCDDCDLEGLSHGSDNHDLKWHTCTKNPGHPRFIPANEFERVKQELHPKWRQPDILDFIRLQIFQTVLLRVQVPGDSKKGTGYMCKISECEKTSCCSCSVCKTSPGVSTTRWLVNIRTCKHVVGDESSVMSTKAHLFYGDGANEEVKILEGVKCCRFVPDADYIEFQCVTHDARLASRIKRELDQFWRLRGSINEDGGPETVVIVSHPHGCPKKVTVGNSGEWMLTGGGFQAFYNTCTCRSSSGAAVWRIGNAGSSHPWPYDGVHHCRRSASEGWNAAKWWPV